MSKQMKPNLPKGTPNKNEFGNFTCAHKLWELLGNGKDHKKISTFYQNTCLGFNGLDSIKDTRVRNWMINSFYRQRLIDINDLNLTINEDIRHRFLHCLKNKRNQHLNKSIENE